MLCPHEECVCPPDLLLSDKRLFETKRKDQLNALKNLVELNDINQQYKIIDIMLKGLFKVCVCVGSSRIDLYVCLKKQEQQFFPRARRAFPCSQQIEG